MLTSACSFARSTVGSVSAAGAQVFPDHFNTWSAPGVVSDTSDRSASSLSDRSSAARSSWGTVAVSRDFQFRPS